MHRGLAGHRKGERGCLGEQQCGAQQCGIVEVGTPVHLDCAAIVGVQSQLQRRQRNASGETGIAEGGEHVAEVFVVGCTEQQPVNVASGPVPPVHQPTETQPGTGKGEDAAGAGPISRSGSIGRRRFGVEHLDAFNEASELLRSSHNGGFRTGRIAAIDRLVPQEAFELVAGRLGEDLPLLGIVKVA